MGKGVVVVTFEHRQGKQSMGVGQGELSHVFYDMLGFFRTGDASQMHVFEYLINDRHGSAVNLTRFLVFIEVATCQPDMFDISFRQHCLQILWVNVCVL